MEAVEQGMMSKIEAAGYVIGAARRLNKVMQPLELRRLSQASIVACEELNTALQQYDRVRAMHAAQKEMACAR